MPRRDLGLVAIAGVLLTAGWVCQSNADNRCPGALTCDINVANVCCPFGSAAWCDGCVADGSGCHTEAYACSDESRVLECAFSATVSDVQCGDPTPGDNNTIIWSLHGTGTIDGCGQETAFVTTSVSNANVDCGSWSTGVFGGCIPPSDDVSTTTWTLEQPVQLARGQGQTEVVQVLRGHGANPILAQAQVDCGP